MVFHSARKPAKSQSTYKWSISNLTDSSLKKFQKPSTLANFSEIMRATPLTIVLNAIITTVFACWPLEVISVDWPKISSCNVLLYVHVTIANRYARPRGLMGRLVSGVTVNVQEMWRYSWFSQPNRNSVTFSIHCELIIPNKVSKSNTVGFFSLQTLPCLQRKPYITRDFSIQAQANRLANPFNFFTQRRCFAIIHNKTADITFGYVNCRSCASKSFLVQGIWLRRFLAMCGRDCNERKLLSAKQESITRPGVRNELDNIAIIP